MGSVSRYGSARLFSSVKNDPGKLRAISLVNDVKFGFSIIESNTKSIGEAKLINNVISPPEPTVSFNYYLSDLDNEKLFNLPVTSHEALTLSSPLFGNIEPIDLAFAIDPGSARDFTSLDSGDHQEVSLCVLKNAYIQSYSFNLTKSGIINVSVSFSGEDFLFKIFKNLSNYSILQSDSEDNMMTNEVSFQINDGSKEVMSDIGGGAIQSTVDNFSFNTSINYRKLYDFGQFFHKKKARYPVESDISISSTINKMQEGELKSIFCKDRANDFLISNKRRECSNKINEKAGMLFKGARLISANYSQSISQLLRADFSFKLDSNRNCGIYFTQHVQTGEVLVNEDLTLFDHIILEDSSTGNEKILMEAFLDMFKSLEEFRTDGACSASY
jgi:hypothetical protein